MYPYRELFRLFRESGYDRVTMCEVGHTVADPEMGKEMLRYYKASGRNWRTDNDQECHLPRNVLAIGPITGTIAPAIIPPSTFTSGRQQYETGVRMVHHSRRGSAGKFAGHRCRRREGRPERQHAAERLHGSLQWQRLDQLASAACRCVIAITKNGSRSVLKRKPPPRKRPTRNFSSIGPFRTASLSTMARARVSRRAKDYGNFELYVDWKIPPKGDSGIYLRAQPQVQIWDSDTLADNLKDDRGTGSGGLWNDPKGSKGKTPLKKADKPVGEWNTFHIIMKGSNVTVFLNGEKVVDDAPLANYWEKGKPLPATGPIELQHHGDKLWFKNIYIRELPSDKK